MKKLVQLLFVIIAFGIPGFAHAQVTTVGINGDHILNYESFTPSNQVHITGELLSLTDASAQAHPEFGRNPYNTPCEDCIELVDRRTDNTRYFIKNGSGGGYFYKQTSSNDLHFRNNKNELLTIDPRLKPTNVPGIYSAKAQNYPTALNFVDGYSELNIGEFKSIKFNRNQTLFSTNTPAGIPTAAPIAASLINYSAGDDGGRITNSWDGINTEMLYTEGSIKTNFVLNNLNAINVNDNFTVIEDVLVLPPNMHIIYDEYEGNFNANGLWVGDLLLVDQFGMEYVRFTRPVVYDADTAETNEKPIFKSGYKIITHDDEYRIQLFVNNNYLKNENRVFPITIDPLVFITTNWTGTNGSEFSPAFCSLTTNVTTPTNATLTNATLYWEVEGNFLGDCGAPAASRCYLNKAQIYFSTSCGTSPITPGWVWSCPPPCAVYGTWGPTVSTPSLVTCLAPSCAAYDIPFTVYLNRIACSGGACATTCIKLKKFNVTIEGYTLEGDALSGGIDLTDVTIVDCATQTVTFTGDAEYGVGPFTYEWTPSGGTGMTDTYLFPLGLTVVTLTITDACGNTVTDDVNVTNPCPEPLPISLMMFNGYHLNNSNFLHWTTASEENSKSFIVERSIDGIAFDAIGSLAGAGNSNNSIDYEFLDANIANNINYYRLQLLDLDGEYSYSNVIAIKSEEILENSITLNSSNTTNGELNLSIITTDEGKATFKIIDITGKKVYQKSMHLDSGFNAVMLYPESMAAGTYILQYAQNGKFETIKFEMH